MFYLKTFFLISYLECRKFKYNFKKTLRFYFHLLLHFYIHVYFKAKGFSNSILYAILVFEIRFEMHFRALCFENISRLKRKRRLS